MRGFFKKGKAPKSLMSGVNMILGPPSCLVTGQSYSSPVGQNYLNSLAIRSKFVSR